MNRIEWIKKAYLDVRENGIQADPECVKYILDTGLFETRRRLNTHEDYLHLQHNKEEPEYWE